MYLHEDEISISFTDLKRIYFKNKGKIKKAAVLTGMVVALFFLLKEPAYLATASFRSSSNKEEQQQDLKNIVKSVLSQAKEDFALSIIQSDLLLHSLIQKMGLQAEVKKRGLFTTLLVNSWENLLSESGLTLSDITPFSFTHVRYEGEKPLFLHILFSSKNAFCLLNQKKELICKGTLHEKIGVSNGEFTLAKVPEDLKLGKHYALTIHPREKVLKTLKKSLEIKPSKRDENLLIFSFRNRDRHLAADLVNLLMQEYQDFLKKENQEVIASQIAYLEKRQEDLSRGFDEHLREHVAFLEKNLGDNGFISSEEEIKILSVPKEELLSRLFEIDIELKRLQNAQGTTHLNQFLGALKIKKNLKAIDEGKNSLEIDIPLIKLESLQELYKTAQEQLSGVYSQTKQFVYIHEQMQNPDFELSTLNSVLGNSSLNGLLTKTMDLSLELSDSTNRSPKEIERIKEAISTQKKTLGQYVGQSIELYKVQASVLEDKISNLQKTAVDFLKLEKELIEQRLVDMGKKMQDLPEKWRLENKLNLKKELSLNIIQGMSRLVETKNMQQHLYQIESKPLDAAYAPLRPKSSHLFLLSFISAVAGACTLFAFHLFKALYRGLPLTYERLKKSAGGFGGKLSPHCASKLTELPSKDLETMRRLLSFITAHSSPMCASILGGRNPNYSHSFAELIAMKGLKVILIECAFDAIVPLENVPGLWHFLEGKVATCPVKKKGSYDFIPTGGTSRHGAEMLGKENFSSLIADYKSVYDVVLLYSSAHPFSSEGHVHMKYADKLILSTCDEPIHELQQYTDWAKKQEQDHKLLFIHFEP